jgi:hypothetical protein
MNRPVMTEAQSTLIAKGPVNFGGGRRARRRWRTENRKDASRFVLAKPHALNLKGQILRGSTPCRDQIRPLRLPFLS